MRCFIYINSLILTTNLYGSYDFHAHFRDGKLRWRNTNSCAQGYAGAGGGTRILELWVRLTTQRPNGGMSQIWVTVASRAVWRTANSEENFANTLCCGQDGSIVYRGKKKMLLLIHRPDSELVSLIATGRPHNRLAGVKTLWKLYFENSTCLWNSFF